jgi:hypothetical protein
MSESLSESLSEKVIQAELRRMGRPMGTVNVPLDQLGLPLTQALGAELTFGLSQHDGDVIVQAGDKDVLLTSWERRTITLGEVLDRLGEKDQAAARGTRISVELTGEFAGAAPAAAPGRPGPLGLADLAPTVIVTESLNHANQVKSRIRDAICGDVEVPSLLFGRTAADGALVALRALVPQAVVSSVTFDISSRGMAAAGRDAYERWPDLEPCGSTHDHPQRSGRPRPSWRDDRNRDALARLNAVFGRREDCFRWPLAPTTAAGGRDVLPLDRFVRALWLESAEGAPPAGLQLVERVRWSQQAFLITPSTGDFLSGYAEIVRVEHDGLDSATPSFTVHADRPLVVWPDEQVADLLGLPLSAVRMEIDEAALRADLAARITVRRWSSWETRQGRKPRPGSGYGYGYGYGGYGSGYGSGSSYGSGYGSGGYGYGYGAGGYGAGGYGAGGDGFDDGYSDGDGFGDGEASDGAAAPGQRAAVHEAPEPSGPRGALPAPARWAFLGPAATVESALELFEEIARAVVAGAATSARLGAPDALRKALHEAAWLIQRSVA